MKRTTLVRGLTAFAAVAIAAAACSTAATTAPSAAGSAAGGASYKIGLSNTLQGNGWREEMVCSAAAQSLASGRVSSLTIDHRNTDAAGQLSDIRDLIAKGVNAIIVNPVSPDAVNAALKEAIDKNIVVVSVDQGVTQPGAYLMSNDQVNYGYLGASWLFKQLNGKGNVIYMRGAAGASADTDRDTGFKKALAENPGIKVVKEVATGWDLAKGVQQMNDILASGIQFDGIWTSGIDNVIVDALKTAKHPFVPIVGADNAGFVKQLLTEPGLIGAAVTNPASVGGAGVTLAIKVLDGQKPADPVVHVTPVVWDDVTDAGKAALTAANDPAIDATWPLGIQIPDWTTYTKAQILACKGPGA
ncbi:MAG TPA: substrate-binding domain-containing protein [Candidatus Limnocylindrales bacterium]